MGANGIINATRTSPCPICGKPDWCFAKYLPDGPEEILMYYCHRSDEGIVVSNGESFYLQGLTSNGFSRYKAESDIRRSKERWIDEQIRLGNPKLRNYWESHERGKVSISFSSDKISTRAGFREVKSPPLASPDRLNEVYRFLFDNLVLEKEDEEYLRAEWDNPNYPEHRIFDALARRYPMVSLPLDDSNRYKSGQNFKNPWRKKLMAQLIATIGEPIGVPGFYFPLSREEEEEVIKWLEKAAKETDKDIEYNEVFDFIKNLSTYDADRWTMYHLSGIMFPVFDTKNRIVRVRIRDSHPLINGEFAGKEGSYMYHSGGWYFRGVEPSTHKLAWPGECVYSIKENINLVGLKPSQLPRGKVMGKYKNFSSFKDAELEQSKLSYNKMWLGTRSGSHISLYTKAGDNMSVVYVVEGEKKAMVSNEILNAPCISLPGVGTFSKLFEKEEGEEKTMMDILIERGMKILVLAYDADKNKNAAVLKAEEGAIKTIVSHGIRMMIAEWNAGMGKGIDDILIQAGFPNFIPVK